jgi:hypothetical protein
VIDFRYHIVSIVAVFLALALGLVLGTTTIDPLVVGDLKDRVTQLVADKASLQGDIKTLRDESADGTAFARAATVPLVQDQLSGRNVVVVGLAGSPSGMRSDLLGLLATAGAHVTGEITVTDRYADPAQSPLLEQTVATGTPPDVVLAGTTPSQRAAELLATALTGRAASLSGVDLAPAPSAVTSSGRPASAPASTPASAPAAAPSAAAGDSRPPVSQSETASIVDHFRQAGLLTVESSTVTAADLILVLMPDGPTTGQPASGAYDALVDLVGALAGSRHAGVVVAGSKVAPSGGPFAAVRSSGVATIVSTVDSADAPYGQVAAVRALRAALFGSLGRFGTAADDRPLPDPVATP